MLKFLQNKVSHSDLIRNVRGEEGTGIEDRCAPFVSVMLWYWQRPVVWMLTNEKTGQEVSTNGERTCILQQML